MEDIINISPLIKNNSYANFSGLNTTSNYSMRENVKNKEKLKIKEEKKKMLEKYKNLTGENLKRPKIPDYILDKKITKIKIKKNKSIKINQESSISTKSNSNKIFFTES